MWSYNEVNLYRDTIKIKVDKELFHRKIVGKQFIFDLKYLFGRSFMTEDHDHFGITPHLNQSGSDEILAGAISIVVWTVETRCSVVLELVRPYGRGSLSSPSPLNSI